MKTIFILALSVLLSTLSYSQIIATTKSGKTVELKDDGTWRYKDELIEIIEESDFSDCDSWTVSEVDKMTGKTSLAAKNVLTVTSEDGKKGFGIFTMRSDKSLILSIKAIGAGHCIDDDSKMIALFRDGARLNLTNDTKFNCKSKYIQYFGGVFRKTKELEVFKAKEIETLRVWTTDGFVELDFSKEESLELKSTINCLMQ